MITLQQGDCLDVFRDVRGLGAIVSDLPAGIGFMGRHWDRPPPGTGHRSSMTPRSREHERRMQDRDAFVGYWAERLAVAYDACRDDAVALIWAIPRTAGWTSRALEDAGWRIADSVSHLFGQGWPKTPGVLKPAREDWIVGVKGRAALDVEACRVERGGEYTDAVFDTGTRAMFGSRGEADRMTIPGNPAGSRPANVVLSHAEGCVARGVRRVRATRAEESKRGKRAFGLISDDAWQAKDGTAHTFGDPDGTESVPAYDCLAACDCGASWLAPSGGPAPRCACGRPGWWACPVAEVDALSGTLTSGKAYAGTLRRPYGGNCYGDASGVAFAHDTPGDSGGASRFYNRFGYYAKCPSGERHAGAEHLLWAADKTRAFGFRRVTREEWERIEPREFEGRGAPPGHDQYRKHKAEQRAQGNVHPTVKRIALMRWLHSLAGAAPIGDLCAGSGSGAIAAHLDGVDWIGSEVCPEALEIARARLAWWQGLSHAAAAEFLATDVMPAPPPPADPRQRALW